MLALPNMVYAEHAFVVSEHDDHGMQVLDLTQVRDVNLSGGPDADYQGRELCFSANANFDGSPFLNTLSIADVTDKANPVGIANVEYSVDGYSHQGTREVANGELSEVAYIDVYPENDNASFEGGTWSNYAFFAQKGVVAVSSMDRGLFIVQPRIGRPGK